MRAFASPSFQEGSCCARAMLQASREAATTAAAARRARMRNLELEQHVHVVHLHAIDVLDLVLLVLGADADLPEVETDADAVERIGPGLARSRTPRAGIQAPGVDADLAVEVDRTER